MKETIKQNDPLLPLVEEYYEVVKEAYHLSGINKKLARKSYAKAGLLALKIQALRFRN